MTQPASKVDWRRGLARWRSTAARRIAGVPGGTSLWLSATAVVISLVALVVACTRSAALPPGALGPVGPTIAVGPAAPTGDPLASGTPVTGGPAAPPVGSNAGLACPPATVTVSDADTLTAALGAAQPGTSIALRDGVYSGAFTVSAAATAEWPAFLCGGPGAVLDSGDVKSGYGLHLDGASHWRLVGFTVRNAQKGVMADRATRVIIHGLTVEQVGDEAIHLRNFSSDNVVENNTVRDTGLRRDSFGEGIYVGSARSNWCKVTGCQPDTSDRNVLSGNHISGTTAEAVDIKEGTTGGTITGNTFDGASMSGRHSDSWVDVKGNGWTIRDNTGRNAREDGFQTHQVVDGWGRRNVFSGNIAEVNGPGWGFHLAPVEDNRVDCDNKVVGAAKGLANVDCR